MARNLATLVCSQRARKSRQKCPSGSETYSLCDRRSFKHRYKSCMVSHVIDLWKMAA